MAASEQTNRILPIPAKPKVYGISCGVPRIPEHGRIEEGRDFTYPNTLTYGCEPGYVLKGPRLTRCESNGQWGGSTPKCHLIDGTFPWWALLIGVVIFIPLSAYIITKLYISLCREPDKDADGVIEISNPDKNNEGGTAAGGSTVPVRPPPEGAEPEPDHQIFDDITMYQFEACT